MTLLLPEHSLSTLDTVHNCDALALLRGLATGSVNCIVTSPPYFGLRDYGVSGQIGLEPTPQAFVATMVNLFREARRVLRDDGVLWLNLGDTYNGGGRGDSPMSDKQQSNKGSVQLHPLRVLALAPKQLIGVPWRVAFGLQDDGWILRSDIIWAKKNCMPESVTDRCTKSHEYIFMFAKSERYFFDQEAIREPSQPESFERANRAVSDHHKNLQIPGQTQHSMHRARANGEGYDMPANRNKRSVWFIATEPNGFAHFATFPQKLIEPMILAGCPHKVCAVCGAPWVRVVERGELIHGDGHTRPNNRIKVDDADFDAWSRPDGLGATQVPGAFYERIDKGFTPTCDHAAATRPGITLDPFMGSGTTALVARRLGRHYIGSELNREYVKLARKRLAEPYTMPMMEMLTA